MAEHQQNTDNQSKQVEGVCPDCKGTGKALGVNCPRCNGTGKLTGIGGG